MHYEVVNITRKPGVKKGHHRLGFFVDLGDKRPIGPGKSHTIEKVTPGMLRLQQKQYITIEEVKDINVRIKKQIEENTKVLATAAQETAKEIVKEKEEALEKAKAEAEEARNLKPETPVIASGLDKEDMRQKARRGKVNTAKVSGDNTDPMGDLEAPVYADGEPNFLVSAGNKK